MFVDVYLEDAFLYNKTLTYKSAMPLEVGVRVRVPLRKREVIGFVAGMSKNQNPDFAVQEIVEILDTIPILNEELLTLGHWLAYETVAPIIRCFQTILPNALKPKSSTKKARQLRYLKRTGKSLAAPTPKQQGLLSRFQEHDLMLYSEARAYYSGVKSLVDKGFLETVWLEKEADAIDIATPVPFQTLTSAQQEVYDAIDLDQHHVYLLHGVTGSGKTEVYLHLAADVIKKGHQVLIMVPEIALTPQMIERVTGRFGHQVAIYHSALNDQEKYEQYQKVRDGKAQIVVGTRSAVFLPFYDLGLIVCDEEHDSSYKQTTVPYYHGRDVAIHRGETHQCPVLLGSASPALESYARALRGVYTLLELKERVNQNFPEVITIDTRQALLNQESAVLTPTLMQAIQARLQNHEQVLLLLNRRGYHPLLKDAVTQEVLMCPNCDVALAYHKEDKKVSCHQCGYMSQHLTSDNGQPLKLMGSGVGTQRLTEMVAHYFPEAKVLRMDADTTRRKNSHGNLLKQFMNHEADILIGTQMIAKGLDIENVTLVGIINADASLTYTDYRSVEATFDMLLQATGRSGRGNKSGQVMIQTYNPEHYAIQSALRQHYKRFFKQEMSYRKLAQYPPYQYLIAIIMSHDDESQAFNNALDFKALCENPDFDILGPTALRKLSGRHRVRLILKGKDLRQLLQQSHHAYDHYQKTHKGGVVVDVNPLTLE